MQVNKLEINGFRCLRGFAVEFAPGKNLIFGANGSGKTSVIEALHILGFGKSFIPVSHRDLVALGGPGFYLDAETTDNTGENRISARMEGRFTLQLNGEHAPLARVGRHLYPLFFSHFLYAQSVDGVSALRRLVDRFIYGLSTLYLHDLLRYNHALRQKNHLLKNLGRSIQLSELRSWNKLLAEAGNNVIAKRRAFTDQLNGTLAEVFAEDVALGYLPATGLEGTGPVSGLLDGMERACATEVRSRRALVGPQRDRFEIAVAGRRLPLFSSGEKKKYAMMLYMAYIDLFRRTRGEYPVFLLDDYDAAMDERNLGFVLGHFPALQVVATAVDPDPRFERRIELKKE